MAIEERSRRALQRRLEEVLGEEHAVALIESLPRGQPATRGDIDALQQSTKGDIDALRQSTKGDIDALRQSTKGDIDALRQSTEANFDAVGRRVDDLKQDVHAAEQRLNERIDLKTQSQADRVRSDLHQLVAGIRTDMNAQTRLLFFGMIGTLMTLAALAFAAARLS